MTEKAPYSVPTLMKRERLSTIIAAATSGREEAEPLG
jgi:hypothetical protein